MARIQGGIELVEEARARDELRAPGRREQLGGEHRSRHPRIIGAPRRRRATAEGQAMVPHVFPKDLVESERKSSRRELYQIWADETFSQVRSYACAVRRGQVGRRDDKGAQVRVSRSRTSLERPATRLS